MIGLHFGDPYFAAAYVVFAGLTSLGVLQIAATRNQREDWSIFPVSMRPVPGYVAGFLLVTIGYGAFFGLWWDYVMVPGLAGWELLCAFGLGASMAVGIARLFANLRRRQRSG